MKVAGEIGVPPAVLLELNPRPRGHGGAQNNEAETIMNKRIREERREYLLKLMAGADLTRDQTADLLYQSVHTVNAWLKPGSSKSSNPVPMWAIELLALKTEQKVSARMLKHLGGGA